MILLSDLDGVGAEWDAKFDLDIANYWAHIPGIPLRHERVSFNFYDNQPPEVVHAINAIMDRPGFYAELEPIDGWVEAMLDWRALGHEVFIVTAPWITNLTCAQDKIDWVARHLGEDWRDRVIITKDKTLIHGDILVDDKPEIHGVRAPDWTQVYFTQPYNAQQPGKRINSWFDWKSVIFDDVAQSV